MKYPRQTNLLTDYSVMVEIIRDAEQSRDFDLAISGFKDIWGNFESDPDFSDFSIAQQAELYRLGGYFLSNYGKVKNRTNFQERGKDLLTKAIEIYSELKDYKGVADAQNVLAMCYIHEGAILEAEAILEQTADDFLHDKLNLIYLQNRGNLLITKLNQRKYDEAFKIIDEIIVPMEFCQDKKACHVFHEKAGNLFRRTKQFSKAIYHYNRAIEYAEEINNKGFISSIKNNLAFLYFQAGKFDLASFYINEAVEIAKAYNLNGLLPHYLDTKAAIYFDEGNFSAALEIIEEAISIFQKGEDAGGETEALWNKCKFLLHLNRKEEAIKLFAKLAPFAAAKMGEFAVDNISKEFADLIHVKKGGSLIEETQRFRRVEIISAIRKNKYELPSAAELLKISLEDLTRIIDQEFPELYEEINIERFAALNNEFTDEKSLVIQRHISQLKLSKDIVNLPERIQTFYFSEELINEIFGFSNDLVIAFESIEKLSLTDYVLIQNKLDNVYSFGKIQYDEIINLYFLSGQSEPIAFSLDEVNLIGKAVSYFPFNEIDNERIEFKSFDF